MGNAQGTPEEPIDVDVLIIGAGATGLGAAYRLNQLGLESWALVDANGNPGGSSGSVKTSEGFRFDLGVQQIPTKSDHQFFETLKTKVRGHKLAPKSKEYKIVNHSGDADLLADYFSHATNLGRVSASANVVAGETTFDQWLVEQFGEKDAAMYHRPLYNKKYSFPASQIPASYSKVLVTNPTEAAVAVEEVEGAVKATSEVGGEEFLYPSEGGQSNFYKAIAKSLPSDKLRFKTEIVSIDAGNGEAETQNGGVINFKYVINTIALEKLYGLLREGEIKIKEEENESEEEEEESEEESEEEEEKPSKKGKKGKKADKKSAKKSKKVEKPVKVEVVPVLEVVEVPKIEKPARPHAPTTGTHFVNIGLRGKVLPEMAISGSVDFSDPSVSFHRANFCSKFDAGSVPEKSELLSTIRRVDNKELKDSQQEPKKGPFWSVQLEVSNGLLNSTDASSPDFVEQVVADAIHVGILKGKDQIVSLKVSQIACNTVIPVLGNRETINATLEYLQANKIWSRGAFGAHNQDLNGADDCLIAGVQAVDNILFGIDESVLGGNVAEVSFEVDLEKPFIRADIVREVDEEEEEEPEEEEEEEEEEESSDEEDSDDSDVVVVKGKKGKKGKKETKKSKKSDKKKKTAKKSKKKVESSSESESELESEPETEPEDSELDESESETAESESEEEITPKKKNKGKGKTENKKADTKSDKKSSASPKKSTTSSSAPSSRQNSKSKGKEQVKTKTKKKK